MIVQPETTEDEQQEIVVDYLELMGICYLHIPNEGKRSKSYGKRCKRLGLKKGAPDILIFEPRGQFCGLALEMKKDKTCKPTKEQICWLQTLKEKGWRCGIGFGAKDAIDTIEKYLENRK